MTHVNQKSDWTSHKFLKILRIRICPDFLGSPSANMVNHILEFPRLVVLIINCFNWNTTKIVVI